MTAHLRCAAAILLSSTLLVLLLKFTGGALLPGQEAAAVSCPAPPRIPEYFLVLDRAENEILQLSEEEFLLATLALEMSPHAPMEALKAQALAAGSYYRRLRLERSAEEYHFSCDSSRGHIFAHEEYFRQLWGEDTEENMEVFALALAETEGLSLEYEGLPACTAFHALSCGVTCPGDGEDYLISVASPYDSLSPYFEARKEFTPGEVMDICQSFWPGGRFDFQLPYEKWFDEIIYSTGSLVYSTKICGFGVTGQEFRRAFELESSAYKVEYTGEVFLISTRGMGHGVGMSQHGAIQMAAMGASCQEILAWYYPGTDIKKAPQG